ncbi:MAG: GyrI-like domain-containing protein [Bacteroidales bacterium]|jgi:AraC family transcriptional regulator
MEPRIEILSAKILVGKKLKMSLADNKTFELWRSFMPERKKINNVMSADLFSVKVYDGHYNFQIMNPGDEFEKWAAVEVSQLGSIPESMEPLFLEGGLYAVFIHKGTAASGSKTFRYIFETWLPASDFILDGRPHFEILGAKYKNDDPASEEEIWIPVKHKTR